jgi:hypothetical protein
MKCRRTCLVAALDHTPGYENSLRGSKCFREYDAEGNFKAAGSAFIEFG